MEAGQPPAMPTTPTKKPKTKITRGNLRYHGKSFNQWKTSLQTELSPDRRLEAIRAMAAFGARGYAKEAAEVIAKLMRQHGFKVSPSHACTHALPGQWMSGKGNCYDNAAVETFFKTIKAEILWQRSWKTRRDAEIAIFEYINGFYNPRRRHSALGWKSPLAFEAKAA